MKLIMQETEEFLTLPEDTLVQVVVTEITEREVPPRDGKDGWTSLSFKFKILDVPGSLGEQYQTLIGSNLFGSTGSKLTTHPDNKLRQWIEALLDMQLESAAELDTEILIGRKARAAIGNYVKAGSTVANHKVKALFPLASATVGAPPRNVSLVDDPPF